MSQKIPSLSQGLHVTDTEQENSHVTDGMSEREKIQYEYGQKRDMTTD